MPKGYTKEQLKELYNSFIGMRQGHLVVVREATKEENDAQSGNSKWWLCKCDCGNETFVKTAYLQGTAGRGDYKINSCGCYRTIRHFLSSAKTLEQNEEDEKWLYTFYLKDWDKFSLLHNLIIRTIGIKANDWNNKEEYKNFYETLWNDVQFNAVYNFWKQQNKTNTFYDWAKPSIDHIIPVSRGGTNTLNNLQFLTTFENLAKRDMTQDEWIQFKKDTNTKSDYFIENILGGDF